MKKKELLLMVACSLSMAAHAQKLVKTYYDYNHQHVHETYYTDNYGTKNGTYTEYSEYGGILQQGAYKNDQMVGGWTVKDNRGKLMVEAVYDNDGKYNGQVVRYTDAHKYSVENYKHGLKNGRWKTWYSTEDGENAYTQLHYDQYYKNDLDDSIYMEYSKDGKMITQRHYKDGVLNGEEEDYNGQGALIVKRNYLNGNLEGDAVFYDVNGSGDIMTKGEYKNGKFLGKWKISCDADFNETENKAQAVYYRLIDFTGDVWKAMDYYATGEKQGEETLIQIAPDVMVGHYAEYYKNGRLQEVGRQDDQGKLDSTVVSYYENGQVSESHIYEHGKLKGAYVAYYEDGKTFVKGVCTDDCRVGQWNIWDKNGNLVFMEDYSTALNPTIHIYKNGNQTYKEYDGSFDDSESSVKSSCVWPWPTKGTMALIDQYSK